MTTLGLGSALVAAVPGIIDYLGTTPPRSAARSTARRHALSNVSALACFALARARRPAGDGPLPPSGIALSLLGTALLITAGLLRSTLVYHHHVGSVEPAEEAPLRRHASEEAAAAAFLLVGAAHAARAISVSLSRAVTMAGTISPGRGAAPSMRTGR